jgi:hypothetical protein
MFGIRDEITRELEELRDNEKARKVSLTLQNDDGLRLDDERVRETVAYAGDGGGEIKARTKLKQRFDSSKNGTKIAIEGQRDIDESTLSATISRVVERIFGSRR